MSRALWNAVELIRDEVVRSRLGEAVGGPRRLSSDPAVVRRLLDLVPIVPRLVAGRDELEAGEMRRPRSCDRGEPSR